MEQILIILAGAISLSGTIPYVIDILRGKTKPRIASWLVWAILTGIAAAASLADKQYPAAILAVCMTISCGVVAILGSIKNGKLSFEKFDLTCLFLSLLGLCFWYIFNSPSIALISVICIDAIAALPTLRHAYSSPHEETLIEFLMAGFASCLTLVAAGNLNITAIAYPLYIIIFDSAIAIMIIWGRRNITYNQKV